MFDRCIKNSCTVEMDGKAMLPSKVNGLLDVVKRQGAAKKCVLETQ